MHNVLSWTRVHTEKNRILAMYHPETNMAYVDKVKTQHFKVMGKARGGKEWLLPEEALFLLERGSLDCRWPPNKAEEEERAEEIKIEDGAPMSLQGAYAAFIGFEGGVGGKLTLEMFTVYSGLKRAGYFVFRVGCWDDDRGPLDSPKANALGEGKAGAGYLSRFFAEIWRRISSPRYTVSAKNLAVGPLVKPGLYRNYADIYRLMNLIPTVDRTAPPQFTLEPDPTNPFRIHFDVYKSGTGNFKKSNRGPPDFRVAVVNARESSVPTASQLNDLLATTPYDPPNPTDPMYKKLKQGSRNVILAIVDNGIPSYIKIADSDFSDVKLYERTGKAPRGKGGGRGRGGRGRGRGRGR
jgi:tRNA-splicing endonuclease subunit Sen54